MKELRAWAALGPLGLGGGRVPGGGQWEPGGPVPAGLVTDTGRKQDVLAAVTKQHDGAASDDRDVFSHGLEWRCPRAGLSWGWRGGRFPLSSPRVFSRP